MRFTVAWSNVLSQNITLRFALVVLGISSLVSTIVVIRLISREPLIIERGCYSKLLTPLDAKHTEREVEAFLREAIPARFDTDSVNAKSFLSTAEASYRAKEQEEMAKKEMRQKVLVNFVKTTGGQISVDADRVISVGKIRSALSFRIKAELYSTDRSLANPYGLILKRVSQIQNEEGANAK